MRPIPRPVLLRAAAAGVALAAAARALPAQSTLVLQSDFGTRDGAVASMKGVATGVDPALRIHDLTHEIAPFDIWEGAYRLRQVVPFWPAGTVFVSIVDPGVGTERLAVVARTRAGQYVVTPDNGTLTLLAPEVAEVRAIDVARHRLAGSERSHTFHGRDLFAYVGARLAAGRLRFDDVGPPLARPLVALEAPAARREGRTLVGMVAMIDRPFGNLWTNLPAALVDSLGWRTGDTLAVSITHEGRAVTTLRVPFVASFGAVPVGEPLAYLNSLLDVAIALNQADFAARFGVRAGPGWVIRVTRAADLRRTGVTP